MVDRSSATPRIQTNSGSVFQKKVGVVFIQMNSIFIKNSILFISKFLFILIIFFFKIWVYSFLFIPEFMFLRIISIYSYIMFSLLIFIDFLKICRRTVLQFFFKCLNKKQKILFFVHRFIILDILNVFIIFEIFLFAFVSLCEAAWKLQGSYRRILPLRYVRSHPLNL